MQPKFTFKSPKNSLWVIPKLFILICFFSLNANSQIVTLTTEAGTGYTATNSRGPVNSQISFVIENTNGFPVLLTQVDAFFDPAIIGGAVTGSAITLWYSSTSLSGPMTTTAPTWQIAGSGTLGTVGAAGYYPAISGMSFSIPAGAIYRFAFQSTLGISYSNPGATPNTFSSNGVNLSVGDFQIGGMNVGYAGDFPGPITLFNPRFFTGRVHLNVSASPCSGTPAPGNTISSANPVCPAVNFTLSLQNSTSGSGVTYQWQSATGVGGPWTNITGATNPTYTTSIITATAYRCNVTCSGNTGTSNTLLLNLNLPSSCYCIPPASDCATFGDMITRVRISSLDNASTCGGGPPAGYTNYAGTVAAPIVYSGAANNITVDAPAGFAENVAVWIDYNQNGQFETSEFTNVGVKAAGQGSVTNAINIPANATSGVTRMRVRLQFGGAFPATNACGPLIGFNEGETEDYAVNIQPCVPISFTSHPANSSVQCSGNASFTIATVGSLPSYSWQYRVNPSSAWQTVTATAPFPGMGGINSTTLTLSNVSTALNGYQFRALVTGGCSAVDFSNPATLTITPLIATVNPTAATICNGSIQPLTLTNASAPVTVTFTNNTPTPIPDGVQTGIMSNLAVSGIPAGAVVTNVSVTLNITHTWVGDLDINLIAPNNVNMNLVGALNNGTGNNSTDNFIGTVISSTSTTPISGVPAPRTGTFTADRLNGYGPTGNTQTSATTNWPDLLTILNGTWKLAVADFFTPDPGTINSWSISITYGAPVTGVWTQSSPSNTIFTDPAATTPYVAGSQATTVYVKPTANTVYTVVYTSPTPCVSAPTNIQVNVVNPITNVVSPTNKSVCVGGNTSFSVSASGGPITYQWQVSTNGGSTYTNITGATSTILDLANVTQAMNGNLYRCVLTAAPCVGSTTTTAATLTVNPLPTITLTASPTTTIKPGVTTTINVASTPTGATYSWLFNGNILRDANGNPITTNSYIADVDHIGNYIVTVTDVNGCTNTSSTFAITALQDDKLFIYPNPAQDGKFQVRVYSGINFDYRKINIYNSSGHRVVSRDVNISSPWQKNEFDLSGMASGVYIVEVVDKFDTKTVVGKVVIQR